MCAVEETFAWRQLALGNTTDYGYARRLHFEHRELQAVSR